MILPKESGGKKIPIYDSYRPGCTHKDKRSRMALDNIELEFQFQDLFYRIANNG